jgi:hypothetical protein
MVISDKMLAFNISTAGLEKFVIKYIFDLG